MKPGDYYEAEVEFTAPTKIGHYISYYRLNHGINKSLGPKVWCDIEVSEPDDDLAKL